MNSIIKKPNALNKLAQRLVQSLVVVGLKRPPICIGDSGTVPVVVQI